MLHLPFGTSLIVSENSNNSHPGVSDWVTRFPSANVGFFKI